MNQERTKIYFASDVHLGFGKNDPKGREERFVKWLRSIETDAKALVLLGDIWDFWYEYKYCIPKEGVKVVGTLMELMEKGVEIYATPGNHDYWYYHFFQDIGIKVFKEPRVFEFGGKRFFLAHGDGLHGGTLKYRIIRWAFTNRVLQVLFDTLHPRVAFAMGTTWSYKKRSRERSPYEWKGESEDLMIFAREYLKKDKVDYFIFGHFHTSAREVLEPGTELLVIKDWISGGQPCAIFDGESLKVCE